MISARNYAQGPLSEGKRVPAPGTTVSFSGFHQRPLFPKKPL